MAEKRLLFTNIAASRAKGLRAVTSQGINEVRPERKMFICFTKSKPRCLTEFLGERRIHSSTGNLQFRCRIFNFELLDLPFRSSNKIFLSTFLTSPNLSFRELVKFVLGKIGFKKTSFS